MWVGVGVGVGVRLPLLSPCCWDAVHARQLQDQVNVAEANRALLLAQVNAAEAARAAGDDALRVKEVEVCELRDKLLPRSQARASELASRVQDLENRVRPARKDVLAGVLCASSGCRCFVLFCVVV